MEIITSQYVICISVADGIAEENAKEIISVVTQQLDKPKYRLDGFNDIDTSGNDYYIVVSMHGFFLDFLL